MKDTKSSQPALKAGFVILILAMLWLGGTQVGVAQNTLRVPEDFPTIPTIVARLGDTFASAPADGAG
jgi:hypothetical protein